MRVLFNNVQEFLAEAGLDAEAELILREVVRVSCKHTRRGGEPITSVSVVAGYLTLEGLVQLDRYCGEYFPQGPATDDGTAAANRVSDELHAALSKLGLAVRSGMFVE